MWRQAIQTVFGDASPQSRTWRVKNSARDNRFFPFAGSLGTVRYSEAIYALHALQRKSKSRIATPKRDHDLIRHRLAEAERLHREGKN
jgi:hypothetical protein